MRRQLYTFWCVLGSNQEEFQYLYVLPAVIFCVNDLRILRTFQRIVASFLASWMSVKRNILTRNTYDVASSASSWSLTNDGCCPSRWKNRVIVTKGGHWITNSMTQKRELCRRTIVRNQFHGFKRSFAFRNTVLSYDATVFRFVSTVSIFIISSMCYWWSWWWSVVGTDPADKSIAIQRCLQDCPSAEIEGCLDLTGTKGTVIWRSILLNVDSFGIFVKVWKIAIFSRETYWSFESRVRCSCDLSFCIVWECFKYLSMHSKSLRIAV